MRVIVTLHVSVLIVLLTPLRAFEEFRREFPRAGEDFVLHVELARV